MPSLFAIFSLLFICAQGSEDVLSLSLKKEHEGLVGEVKDLLVGTMKDFKADVDGQVGYLQEVLQNSPKEGERRIHEMYDSSILKLKNLNAPQECLTAGENQLREGKELTQGNFLKCSNMTTAVKDLVAIVFDAGTLVSDILLSADDVFNGFGKCKSWNPWTFVSCTYRWLKSVISDAFKSFKEMKAFSGKVGTLIADVKAQVDFCWNQGKDKHVEHFTAALAGVHDCTLKPHAK